MDIEIQLPALLFAAPPAAEQPPLWLTNARLFDGTRAPVRDHVGVLVDGGRITRVGAAGDGAPDGSVVIDLAGKTLMPGLINGHMHGVGQVPDPGFGAQPTLPGTASHLLGAKLREFLQYGVTTVRDMGTYGDQVMENRQAMRFGAYRGARVLTCGLIISGTAPGGLVFEGMYREADGPDEVRKGVREQIRRGADFIKIMTDGARSVELESGVCRHSDGSAASLPNQLTYDEMTVAVEEARRMGYRVAAHAEGLAGCEAAIDLWMQTVEHGFYLHRRPELLDRMAERDVALVPTFSSSYVFAGRDLDVGLDGDPQRYCTPELDAVANANIRELEKTLQAAQAAGTLLVMGGDDLELRRGGVWIEVQRLVHHGLPAHDALVAATSGAARALGLDELGQVKTGNIADLAVVDGDPIANPELLGDRGRFWLVLQGGSAVAGSALEVGVADLGIAG
ncbi:amidohydrolase family protein [Phytoactinopolyspora mesophila]|uniref:Amidohydrolase family protein n=1 Tax=Phytoactinopolyspora mesophila TaxID=2650750 RepID=A0A7K3M3P6_9ACTN|nr:amidohydrolase family protein [Phytoactinopolyspora mesophila]NDL57943.1 amidohydrolase family protein [Phytoactinopolyspora mesophila]